MTLRKKLLVVGILSSVILIIPLIAMQFTTEVQWDLLDFSVAAVLLLVTGTTISFLLSVIKSMNGRIATVLVMLLAFLLIWAELAVGLIGTPLAGS